MKRMKSAHGDKVVLDQPKAAPEQVHVFDQREIDAIDAAIAARRPLLVRGEPGIGKSQLARAAAVDLGRTYVQHVVDSRTESRDLLWHFDAVARLAAAQLKGALRETKAKCRSDFHRSWRWRTICIPARCGGLSIGRAPESRPSRRAGPTSRLSFPAAIPGTAAWC